MIRNFTLEYWIDEGWHVGRIKEVPGVFSQGETLDELEKNVREAYALMMADEDVLPHAEVKFDRYSLTYNGDLGLSLRAGRSNPCL